MNKKSLIYSGLLLLALVVVSVLLNRGFVQGVVNEADIHLESDSEEYLLGQPENFSATLDFAVNEEATVHQVRLVVDGPQPLDVALPLQEGTFDLSAETPSDDDTLTVDVSFVNVEPLGGTIPPSATLPSSTLPGGGQFKGIGPGARIVYNVQWRPGIFLDPPPVFTLVPQTEVLFPIPQLEAPETGIGTVLPDTELQFSIPILDAPSGTVLPSVETVFSIPQVTISSSAPAELPDLPDTAASFDIPTVSVESAPPGVTNYPDSVIAYDIPQLSVESAPAGVPDLPNTTQAFAIPDLVALGLVPTAPAGVPNLPDSALAFSVPGDASPRGIATDGTDFWLIIDGITDDQIIKVDGTTGAQIGAAANGPSNNLDGITYLNGFLWVVENQFRCFDDIDGNTTSDEPRCDRSHRIFKVDPTNIPDTDAEWAPLFGTAINAPEIASEIGGITAQGSGATGTLWLARKTGGRLFNIEQNGNEIASPFTDQFVSSMEAAAFDSGVIYTSDGGTITAWTTTASKIKDTITNPSRGNIRGMTFKTVDGQPVLFFASATDKKVYKGFFATTVTQNPRGMGYSGAASAHGEALWLLLDGDPKDKIVKVDPADGSVINDFSSDGVHDAPSANTEGITYHDSALWVVTNEGFVRKLYKINASTGATISEFDLGSTAQIFGDLGGLTSNGTSLVTYEKNSNTVYIIDPATGGRDDIRFPCCPPTLNGAKAIAYHSGRNQYFFAKSSASSTKLGTLSGDFSFLQEQSLTKDSVATTSVEGMAFAGNLLYTARSGEVLVGFLATTVTTNPKGVALSPTGSGPGRALWVLVDGSPADKLLKLNPDTGALLTAFGTNGAVDAPSDSTEGVDYFNNFLWIVANAPGGRFLYKVDPADGSVVDTIPFQSFPTFIGDIGGITNNGTNLVVYEKSGNVAYVLSADLTEVLEQKFPCCPSFFGAKGFAYNDNRNMYFAASGGTGGKIATLDANLNFVQEVSLKESGSNVPGIQGLTFDGNVLIAVRSGKVHKSFLATTVTTEPVGITFTPAASAAGKALWILVNGDPLDKLLKVDPDTGLLITTFGDDGAVDAPSSKTEGITYFNGSLWVVANDGFDRRLYEVNVSTGALVDTINLNTLGPMGDLGGLTNNGTNLVAYDKSGNTFYVLSQDLTSVEQRFTCCPSFNGARALAFHSGRSQYFAARGNKLAAFDSQYNFLNEKTLTVDNLSITGVEGLAFDGDVLYVARNASGTGKVSKGALRTTVTTNPRGIAFSPDGSSYQGSPIGRALWVLVDGDPNDMILKLDADTGALDTTFSSDGAADAPNSRTEGITFLNNFLWVISNAPDGRKLHKIKATDGSELDTFNLSSFPGGFVFEDLGGITTDGTDLLLFTSDSNHMFVVDTSGERVSDTFVCCPPTNGGRGVAFRSSKSQLFVGKSATIVQYTVADAGIFMADQFTTSASGIQGMTFVEDVLYIAHGTGTVSKAAPPSDITNNPRGLTYDAGADELYLLVDGKAADHILVLDPDTGDVLRDFPAPDDDTDAISFLNGNLYVAARDDDTCCPPPTIFVLDPADGSVVRSLPIGSLFDRITGLATDGDSLIAVPEFGGPQAVFINPQDGSEEERTFFFDPFGPLPDGFQAVAFDDSEEHFFLLKGKSVFRFDDDGRKIGDITIVTAGFDNVRGATFVGDLLYMAEGNGKTIHAAGIPVAPTIITTDPRGMTTDGTSLYVVVDASPRDKIMKLDAETGELDLAFGDGGAIDSPGTETDGLAYHNGHLYAVTNDQRTIPTGGGPGGFEIVTLPIIHKLDPVTGEELEHMEIHVEAPFGPPFRLMDLIGALASDGDFLYAGVKGSGGIMGAWFKIDPDNLSMPAQQVNEFAGRLPFMPSFGAMEVTTGPTFPSDRKLVASGSIFGPGGPASAIARFNKATGVMFDQFMLAGGPKDVRGMAYIGLTLFLADANSDSILGTSLPENTVEQTIVGNYTAYLVVDVSPDLDTSLLHQSNQVAYAVVRNDEVIVELTSPEDGFILTDTLTTIAGRINDPAIDEVEVGIQLPFTFLIDDQVDGASTSEWDAESIAGGQANWHVVCAPGPLARVSSPDCAWRYGRPSMPSFNTGGRTAGTLTAIDPDTGDALALDVNPGTMLGFMTGYNTEPVADADLKVIEVAEVTTDLQGNDVVGTFQPIAQIVGKGFGFAPPPAGAHPTFHYIELDPLFINPNLQPVQIDLSPLAGKRIALRFRFDSVHGFANEGEGWYLDDIRVAGAGLKTVVIPTQMLATPLVIGGVTFYRTFSTQFELAEGENTVGAFAKQPYNPFLSDLFTIAGFVDQTPPVVDLSGLPEATSDLFQTLLGFVEDATFQSLEVTQTSPNGSQVIFSLNSLPEDGEFSLPVSLVQGLNTFEAIATDGGGLQGSATLEVIADITPPTAQVKIVTITSEGEALVGDQYYVVVAASDPGPSVDIPGSGVASVIDDTTDIPMTEIGDAPPILVAMHNLDAVGGQPATHVKLASVQIGTPVGVNSVPVRIVDRAGNESIVNGELNVVSARSNRNFYLFPGINFVGLALIPDDGDPDTTDDASLDRLMAQDVTESVNPDFAAALGRPVTLGDVIDTTFAFNNAGNFIVHTPGPAADTLTDMEAFQGMIMKARETQSGISVFQKVNVEGFTAQQAVPIRMNIQGVFFRPGELPPEKTLRVGYNLIAPHILQDTLFDVVYRGALIPEQLAVSAISFERRISATASDGEIRAEVFEGFITRSLGGLLKPVLSYWTFVVRDAPVNPTTPTITP